MATTSIGSITNYAPCVEAIRDHDKETFFSSLERVTREQFEEYLFPDDPSNFFHMLVLSYPLAANWIDNKDMVTRLLQICADKGFLSTLLVTKNKAGLSPLEDALQRGYDAYAPLVKLLLPYYPYETLVEVAQATQSPIVRGYLTAQIAQRKLFALGLVTAAEGNNTSKGFVAKLLFENRLATLIGTFLR